MKTTALGDTILALAAFTSLSPAMAQGPRPSGGNTWHGMTQPADANLVTGRLHYELQYHYAGRHPRWVGQWVLVR
jgi:hypothetical protein